MLRGDVGEAGSQKLKTEKTQKRHKQVRIVQSRRVETQSHRELRF